MLKKTKKSYWVLEKFASQRGIIHGFSTRKFGNMSFIRGKKQEVIGNRLKFAEILGFDKDCVVQMNLVHGVRIAEVDKYNAGSITGIDKIEDDSDALLTNEPGIFLLLLTADCAPFLFYDPLKRVIGLAHVGWRGAIGKLPNLMVKKMVDKFGSKKRDILVGIGPALCGSCDIQKRPLLQENLVEWINYLYPLNDKMRVENIRFSLDQLIKIGVPEENIELGEICTKENWQDFFSWEAAQKNSKEEKEGRFATVIGMD